MNMPKIYLDLDENALEKGIKVAGVSAKKKQVEFNQDVHMNYISKITGAQTN